jgi:signal transduction histidine kinase
LDNSIVLKWQSILDLAATLFHVPSALIMRLHHKEIEVFVKSNNASNPYEKNEKAALGNGLYCETVVGTDQILEVADAQENPIWAENPDVKLNMVNYLGVPIKWPNGNMFGTICVLDDHRRNYDDTMVTLIYTLRDTIETDLKLVQSNIDLKDMLVLLEKSQEKIFSHEKNKWTSELISSIVHEISTPIGIAYTTATIMKSATKELLNLSSNEEAASEIIDSANFIIKNLQQASSLIQAFKTIEDDQRAGCIEQIDLCEYITSIVLSMKEEFKRNNIEVSLDLPTHEVVIINTAILTQVLISLLVNAIKHAYHDVNLKTLTIKLVTSESKIYLYVSDNGCGISKLELREIFDIFVRLNKEEDGSGMGLTIVQELVTKKLNGVISCQSDSGKGSTFEIVLPKEATDERN